MNRFVIFDLDDTVVDSAGAVEAWFAELVEQRGVGQEVLDFIRAERQRPDAPQVSLHAISQRFRFAEAARDLRHAFRERHPQLTRPFDGVLDGLRALRERGWRTALLTNGSEEQQRPKLHDGLDALFDVLYFAYDETARKPDAAAFQQVADRAGAKLAGAWMIGDSLTDDVAPAASLGMSTIWVSRGAALPANDPAVVRPDEIVARIDAAFPILMRDDEL